MLTTPSLSLSADQADAKDIASRAEAALQNCLSRTRRHVLAWVLPQNSGFRAQMTGGNSRKVAHHWTSPTGADMARFFLPSLFPDVPRLLYIDNDVIISCCLDEIFDTNLNTASYSKQNNAIVGLALDDLKWATATQYTRHYNSTHPLVIKNMRRRGFSSAFATVEQIEREKDTYMKIQALQSSARTTNNAAYGKAKASFTSTTTDKLSGPYGQIQRKHVKVKKNNKHQQHLSNQGQSQGQGLGQGQRLGKIKYHLTDENIGGLGAPGEERKGGGIGLDVGVGAIEDTRSLKTKTIEKMLELTAMKRARTSIAVEATTDISTSTSTGTGTGKGSKMRSTGFLRGQSRKLDVADSILDPNELSSEEFVKALPRYPNDGVMLFDVPAYNIANILHIVEEIAIANSKEGNYVVNLGTQQFTVLALWDRWAELSPRANLRHFPDMARGMLLS